MTKYRNEEERHAGDRERQRRYRERHPDRRKKSKERWRKANLEKYAAYTAKWVAKNKNRKAIVMAMWEKKNSARRNALKAKRMADRMHATPAWANHFFIEEIYDLARLRTKIMGYKWSVDHIVPLKSNSVCGLHVEHNLRVIPHRDNISKKNRWWPDMP